MANRKRATLTLPEELETNEKLSTKKESAQRKKTPCPPIPIKLTRKSIFSPDGSFDKAKAIYFINQVELSPNYNPNLDTSYFDQLYPKHFLIGEGSFGRVYRAQGVYDKRLYAIKRLKPMISFHDKYAEIRNNEKVGVHPNCVQFYMAWEEGYEVFMLLEACQMSLSDYAMRNNDIPEVLLWDVLYDMCKALKYLHSKLLLHLDVKPDNIMMKNGYYKLADFGILVDLSLEPLNCKSTLSDGDSKYLAIEVLDGIYTPFCDIFGLGLTLLELAVDLELPSNGPLWQQLRREILPQEFYDKVSREFTIIIQKMLKLDYKKRPTAQKILKFNKLMSIEKRDKTKPRINYAAEYVSNDVDGIDNDNNNVIVSPKFQLNVSCEDHLRIPSERRIFLSPKILFRDVEMNNGTQSAEDYFASPQRNKNLTFSEESDNSLLEGSLQTTHDSELHSMETDTIDL